MSKLVSTNVMNSPTAWLGRGGGFTPSGASEGHRGFPHRFLAQPPLRQGHGPQTSYTDLPRA